MRTAPKSGVARASSLQRRVVILGLPPVDALDVIGPVEVFTVANQLHEGRPPYTIELVCSGLTKHVETDSGIGLVAHRTLEEERCSRRPIDTLIVACGMDSIERWDETAIAWIRSRSETARRVCSICVGAFALAEAGLLDGRKATTHWRMAQRFAERYPEVQVDPAPIWIKDGRFYTSAGISSGIDLALSLVAEDHGDSIAMDIAKNLVLFLRRPGGQAQFSVTLRSQRGPDTSLNDLCIWIGENLQADLTVETLAERYSTSVRTLIRLFQRKLMTNPAKYVEDVRIEAVCRALEVGDCSMEEISRRSGYHSVDVLRKAFHRRLGITPKEYALRFAHQPTPT